MIFPIFFVNLHLDKEHEKVSAKNIYIVFVADNTLR
jgi:hypothetical protein